MFPNLLVTDPLESAEFKQHIRDLLYDYCTTHITTNYITFTEDVVAEFLERLKPIPLADPYSLTLLPDPFVTLSQFHSLSTLEPYDETAETTQEACAHIKRWGAVPKGKPRTEKIANEWSENGYQPPPERFIPALTRKARKATPKLGKKTQPACHGSLQDLVKSQKISPVDVEPVEEPKLVAEEILQVALEINPEELPAVKALLQTTTEALRPQKACKNRYLDPSFLCTEFPGDNNHKPPEEEFVPLFPRSRVPASESGQTSKPAPTSLPGLKGLADIPSVVSLKQVEVEDPEPDISRQNLVIVDGWEAIKSSPLSTPSSARSDSDEEDQLNDLFLKSSPPTTDPPLVEEVENSKMEEVVIPRSRRIGGKSGITPHLLAGKTLQTFLGPLLSKSSVGKSGPASIHAATLSVKEVGPNSKSAPSSPTPSSLVGQPPSVLTGACSELDDGKELEKPEQSLDSELQGLYEDHVEALEDLIMNEKIEDKEKKDCMLWEVPDLPPLCVRSASEDRDWLHVPKNFVDLLVPPATNSGGGAMQPSKLRTKSPHQFLKKAKGTQSLGLALSWVPFTVDKKLPTVHGVVGVDKLLDDDVSSTLGPAAELDSLFKVLKIDIMGTDSPDTSEEGLGCFSFLRGEGKKEDYRPPQAYSYASKDFQIVLNRQERRRLARFEGRIVDGDDDDCDIPEDEPPAADVAVDDDVVFDHPTLLSRGGEGDVEGGARRPLEDDAMQVVVERPNKRLKLALEDNRIADAAIGGEVVMPRSSLDKPQLVMAQVISLLEEDHRDCDYQSQALAGSWHLPARHLTGNSDDVWDAGEDEDEDKENFPPPTSSYSSSMLVDSSVHGDVEDLHDYDYDYDIRDQGDIAHPYYPPAGPSHRYGYHYQDYATDEQAPYPNRTAADDYMGMDSRLEGDRGGFEGDVHDRTQEEGSGSFEPLSFASQYPFAAGVAQISLPVVGVINESRPAREEAVAPAIDQLRQEPPVFATVSEKHTAAATQAKDVPNSPLSDEPKMASQSLGIFAFAQLRAKKVSAPSLSVTSLPEPGPTPANLASSSEQQPGLPPELMDKDTLTPSSASFAPPRSVHRYMASLDLIQKHALVCALRSEECAVDLVERRSLGGADLILDPYCAVVFLSLFTLPARCQSYVDRVSNLSQRFRYLLVIFEAYPEQLSRRTKASRLGGSSVTSSSSSGLYAYTPPIVKAIKKFRRDINIAEACGSKRPETVVQYAFVDNVHEAALFTRWFGDWAEDNDMTGGSIWYERRWLGEDYSEEEEDCLAEVHGLNHFSASMILSQMPLQDFVHLLPEERAEVCGGLLANEIIAECNADIEQRLHALTSSSDTGS